MTNPTIRIHNSETNEIIDREMTNAEHKVYLEKIVKLQSQETEAEAKAAQKQAVLDRLGLTAEEARLLLGGN
jgi:hypothetical protein